jgi:hypothetical protein
MWKTGLSASADEEDDVRTLPFGVSAFSASASVVPALFLGAVAGDAYAQNKTQAVEFVEGVSSAKMTGQLSGYETMTYTLAARAGQSARIVFRPDNGDCEFLVYRPGQTPGQNEAFFNGSKVGNEFTGILQSTGTYMVWVGLSRDAARGLQSCGYTIAFSITGGEP